MENLKKIEEKTIKKEDKKIDSNKIYLAFIEKKINIIHLMVLLIKAHKFSYNKPSYKTIFKVFTYIYNKFSEIKRKFSNLKNIYLINFI